MEYAGRCGDYSALQSSCCEFNKKCRRISIKNMPPGINNQDISDLLKPYHYQQIHIDKMSLSCKAVLLDGESASRCMKDLNLKTFRGSQLIVSLASCDFMLCVTQLPAMYTKEQFLTLITPFGTPERCFLVHSEVTGKSKGYGCVEFTSKESSIKAKNHLNGKSIGSYTLQVHWLDTIPQLYSGLHSSCLLVENLPVSCKDSKALRDLFTLNDIRPIFCQSANCAEDDFSILEYSNAADAEKVWFRMNNQKVSRNFGSSLIRVSFCVPGPCGLVILNSLKASRDLKRNNPSGGLLPTPVQKLDSSQFPMKTGVNTQAPATLPLLGGALAQAATHNDPEVQRLLKALHVRLLNVPESSVQPLLPDVKGIPPPNRQLYGDGKHTGQGYDMTLLGQLPTNQSVSSLSQSRGRSASYDSGVHATDDEVFSSGSSSQEDVARPQESGKDQPLQFLRSGKWNTLPLTRPDGHFNVDYSSAFSQVPSQTEANRSYLQYRPGVIACQREDIQRSDSADSAYGSSQETAGTLQDQQSVRTPLMHYHYPHHKPFELTGSAGVACPEASSVSDQYPRPLPRRPGSDCLDSSESIAMNGVPRPEFLFSSLCKNEGLVPKLKVPNNFNVTSSFLHHRSHVMTTPLPDSSPSFHRKTSLSGLMADLHDIGADSPTQLQLLGSSLMEGLLADSPRSSVDPTTESQIGSAPTGRLIRALNLFSPSECLNSPHTPVCARKRTVGMLPSPEPSPEAGAYVGQHSQGLGGHYAGPLFGTLNLSKRRRSNET